ncbi:hypothetical protein Tco_0139483 [Tanacetum coccineum]
MNFLVDTVSLVVEILQICPDFPIKPLLYLLQKKNWLHLSRNLVILASVICYLQFILIKCTSLGEHLLQSSIGASLGRQQDLIDLENYELKSCGQYGALIPDDMINQDIKDSKAYKTYYDFATGKVPPKKARKYKKVVSPSRKLAPVLEEELAEKPKKAKKPAKKYTIVPTAGFVIRDTPGVPVPKKKAPAKGGRGKGMELLSDAALLEAAQVKEVLQKSKKDSHMFHASGSGDRVGSKLKVLDESQDKTTGTDEGTGTKPEVSDVPKYFSKSENESWGDSDDIESDANEDKEASDSEKTNFDEDENLNLNQNDDEEKEKEEEDVRTPDRFEFNDDEEEYDELYKDVDVKSLDAKREKERKGDAEMTDADKNVYQERSYEQVVDDAHVTLTTTHKTKGSMQSSSVSSDFASKFLNLDNVPLADNEVASMMNVKVRQEESSTPAPPLLTMPVTAIPKTFTVAATTVPPIIQPFSSIPRMTIPTPIPTTELTTSSIPALLDFASLFGFDQRVSVLEQELSQILPKEISDFATPVIQSTINESLENVVLAKSSSQPQSTYEVATSLTEFELKKILLDKLEKSKSYRAAKQHRDLYDALVKSYQLDKDLFETLMSAQAEEPVFETADTEMPQDQGDDLGNTEDQPKVKEDSKHDWFKKPKRPPTPARDWNAGKQIDFRPPQTWISKIAKAGKPPTTFDELMSTPIDFLAYVLHNPKIENLTQEHLVGPAFNLLKGTCKSRVKLKFQFEECYKAVTDKLERTNPEGHEYPFDLSKPLPLIEYKGRQVVPANYFFNNNLAYLKGGSLSSKYMTSTTKTKAAKYDTIEGIEDMVPSLGVQKSKHDVFSTKRIIAVTHVQVMKKYDYGYLEEIIVRREDQSIHKFIEGDFPRLNPRDIEDMLLLLVQKKLSNLERDDLFDFNVALQMFTRRVII